MYRKHNKMTDIKNTSSYTINKHKKRNKKELNDQNKKYLYKDFH